MTRNTCIILEFKINVGVCLLIFGLIKVDYVYYILYSFFFLFFLICTKLGNVGPKSAVYNQESFDIYHFYALCCYQENWFFCTFFF